MSSEATSFFANGITRLSVHEESRSIAASERNGLVESDNRHLAIETALLNFSDEELLLSVTQADKAALAILYRRHHLRVLRVCERIVRDKAEAEDLLQELFLYVFQNAGNYDPAKASVVSWIVQLAYHRAIDRRRYLSNRQHYKTQEFREDTTLFQPGTPTDELMSQELLVKFRKELTVDQQEVLELHFFEGYTFSEIAEKTGQTLGNVRNHHYRGLQRIRSIVFAKKRG